MASLFKVRPKRTTQDATPARALRERPV